LRSCPSLVTPKYGCFRLSRHISISFARPGFPDCRLNLWSMSGCISEGRGSVCTRSIYRGVPSLGNHDTHLLLPAFRRSVSLQSFSRHYGSAMS
jgi:hypothetical protein